MRQITHGKLKLTTAVLFLHMFLAGNCMAQHLLGISNGNYAATNGIIANLSYAADSRHGFYLNVFSANGYVPNINFYQT